MSKLLASGIAVFVVVLILAFFLLLFPKDREGEEWGGENRSTLQPNITAPEAPPQVPTLTRCTETDNGDDVSIKGMTREDGKVFTDTCKNVNTIEEHYCKDGRAQAIVKQCLPGYQCDEGQCAELVKACSDTDNGRKPNKKGRVIMTTMLFTTKKVLYTTAFRDECVDKKTVAEYYCDGNKLASEEVSCSLGMACKDGECLEKPCTDSDNGYTIYEKGITKKGGISSEDVCASTAGGMEYYCEDEEIIHQPFTCSQGYQCADGNVQRDRWR